MQIPVISDRPIQKRTTRMRHPESILTEHGQAMRYSPEQAT